MRYIQWTLAAVVLMLTSSCRNEIDLGLQEGDRKLVVNSINVSGEPIMIQFDQSVRFSDPQNTINHYKVNKGYAVNKLNRSVYGQLKVNGEVVSEGPEWPMTYVPQAGDEVELVARADGLEEVHAEGKLLSEPQVGQPTMERKEVVVIDQSDPFSKSKYLADRTQINIPVVDNDPGSNYYRLVVELSYKYQELDENYNPTGKVIDKWMLCNNGTPKITVNPSFSKSDQSDFLFGKGGSNRKKHLFSDDIYPGVQGERTFNVEVWIDFTVGRYNDNGELERSVPKMLEEDELDFRVTLLALPYDLYYYFQTYEQMSSANDFGAFVSEPVMVHSNIANGIGIFGFGTRRDLLFTLSNKDLPKP